MLSKFYCIYNFYLLQQVVSHVPKPQYDMAHPRPKPAHTLSGHDLEKERLNKATPKELEAAAAIARFASVAEESDSSVSSTMSTPRNNDGANGVNDGGGNGSGGSPLSSSPNMDKQKSISSGVNQKRFSAFGAPSSLSGSFFKGGGSNANGVGTNKGLGSGASSSGVIVRQPTSTDGRNTQGRSAVSFSGVSFAEGKSYAPTSSPSSTGGAFGKPGFLNRFLAKRPTTAGSDGGGTARSGTAATGGREGTTAGSGSRGGSRSGSRRGPKAPVVPCISLRTLRLTRNRLTGPVPKGFEKLTNMVIGVRVCVCIILCFS